MSKKNLHQHWPHQIKISDEIPIPMATKDCVDKLRHDRKLCHIAGAR